MAERPKIDLGLTGYDELFMTDAERKENKLPRIHDIPLELIDDFPGHPFQVRMDEDMQQLVESVKERGVLTPITLRQKEDGRYEIVSGHRRKKACELAGFETVRAEVRDMTRDEAIIYMVPLAHRMGFRTMLVLFRKLKMDESTLLKVTPAIAAARRVILLATMKSWDMVSRHIKRKHLALGFTAWCGVLFVRLSHFNAIR